MQDITPTLSKSKKIIDAYGNGGFKVSGERFEGNIIILPDSVHKFEGNSIEATTEAQIQPVLNNIEEVEILIIGCGKTTEFFSKKVEDKFGAQGINIEYMDTGAAARTYNVLLTEERKVAVVLIAV